jgi:hypothetical protein
MSAPGTMKRPSRARLDVLAGLVTVAVLLLAIAVSAESAHAARGAGAANAPRARHAQTLTRRCDPPPCPVRVVR